MKTITIYELLGMVKDGKAPKKIKWKNTKYILYTDEVTKQTYYQDDKGRFFFLNVMCLDFLNDEIEILEEPIISKLYINNELQYDLEEKKTPEKIPEEIIIGKKQPTHRIKKIENKINEIIDYLKSKGDK